MSMRGTSMKHTFTINNVVYTAKEFDFNTVCDLEESGVSLEEMQKKPTSAVRAYFALCTGGSIDDAGRELQEHIINGGTLNELTQAMVAEMNESDFFQALSKRTKKSTRKTTAQTE